jgi:tetratricopeptide (TPR) repeat protein
MRNKFIIPTKLALFAAFLLCCAPTLRAQSASNPSTAPASEGSIVNGKDKLPTNYDNTINMAATRETNAFKVFQAIPDSAFDKKVKAGDDFIRKFSTSPYLPYVYSILTVTYIQNGQPQKGFQAGERALALQPNDVHTMVNLAQAMARLYNPSEPDAAQKLDKAEQYARKAIEISPTLRKPDAATDQEFAAQNDKNLAMAHSTLGLIDIRRAKYAEAVPELQEAVRLDAAGDPTNLYLLGVANQNSSHFAEALDAFNKCAATAAANLQPACREGAAQAEKRLASAAR